MSSFLVGHGVYRLEIHVVIFDLSCTVYKMGHILCSIEQMLKMQLSMARKFMLQPMRGGDLRQIKPFRQFFLEKLTFRIGVY